MAVESDGELKIRVEQTKQDNEDETKKQTQI